MKDQQINSFNKGMVRDIANNKQDPQSYKNLYNGEVMFDRGSGSYALTNPKGNKRSFVIPEVPHTHFIKKQGKQDFNTNITVVDYNSTLNDGTQYSSGTNFLLLTDQNSVKDIYDWFIVQPFIVTAIAEGSVIVSYSATYDTMHVMFLNGPWFGDQAIRTITGAGEPFNTQVFSNKYNLAHTPNIMGGGDFDDDYVIYTSSDDGWGQIWYLQYETANDQVIDQDPTTLELDITVHLKHNGPSNFQSTSPIRRVISIRESNDYGSIYWTDAFNTIRGLDILRPDSINVPVEQMNLQSSSRFGTLIVDNISSNGSMPSGSSVQFTYRMVSGNGSRTDYAPLTGSTLLTDSNPYQHGSEFEGTSQNDDTTTDKSVTLRFSDLDTSFERIEIAAIVYRYNNIPEVYLETDIDVPVSGEFTYVFTGTNAILENELAIASTFDTIETANDINVKDNRLIAMGLTLRPNDLDWDARAYRAKADGTTRLINGQGADELNVDLANIVNGVTTVDPLSDCINPYNYQDVDGSNVTASERYIFDHQDNLGGAGPNVSYKIIGVELTAMQPNPNFYSQRGAATNPGVLNGTLTLNENEVIDFTGELANYKSPKVNAYLKGYKRGEVYRFGIKFFDKNGKPYPVKWIGDIKFPERHESEDHTVYRIGGESFTKGNSDLTYWTGASTPRVLTDNLGVEFRIRNLESIQDKISGFTIVRAERTLQDKSILGEGIATPLLEDPIDTENAFLPVSPDADALVDQYVGQSTASPQWLGPSHLSFLTPEAHNQTQRFSFSDGDKIIFHKNIHGFQQSADATDGFTVAVGTHIARGAQNNSGDTVPEADRVQDVTAAQFANVDDEEIDLETAAALPYQQSKHVHNFGTQMAFFTYTTGSGTKMSYGATTAKYFVETPADLFTTIYNVFDEEENGLLIANYKRGTFTSHYGGRTYNERQRTKYVDCTSFQSVSSIGFKEIKVFRGDTTSHLWDVLWGGFNSTINLGQEQAYMVGLILFVESSYNLDYRSEGRFLHDFNANSTNNQWGDESERGLTIANYEEQESYNYNNAYNQENNLVTVVGENDNLKLTTDLPASIWPSEPKILGESIDSWRTFLPNNLYDLDAIYGPIARGEIFNNQLLTLQREAVAIVPINERIIVNDEASTQVVLGTGDVIGKHRYISVNSGTNQPFSVTNTDQGIYYLDPLKSKFNMISRGKQDISTVAALDSEFQLAFLNSPLLNDVDPINFKIAATVADQINNRIYITTSEGEAIEGDDGVGSKTFVYNERMQAFELFYPDIAKMYYTNGTTIITPRGNVGYLHRKGIRGQFYDREELEGVKIKFVINKHAPLTKVFNNIEFHFDPLTLEDDHFDNITVTTYDGGTSGTNISKRFRTYRHIIGRDKADGKSRLQGPWAEVEVSFTNKDDIQFIVQDFITHFDVYNLAAQ